ncbi:MAG: IS4 family transposase [Bryobacterales bacterium]|nr:IS4 family transposase [Bryobacterales bacterium]
MATALDRELAGCRFEEARLGRRFRKLVGQLAGSVGQSIPLACQDWSNTKAAYRFLSNRKVQEGRILAGHFQATKERAASVDGPLLILHDTTEFSFYGESAQALGALCKGFRKGGKEQYVVRGILMHSSLAVTIEGLPLGLCAIKFWTRDHFKGTNALKRSINPTRVPIEEKESVRWLDNLRLSTKLLGKASRCVHIGDRESDIYEMFCTAQDEGTNFLIRTCVDRLAVDGKQTISAAMKDAKIKAVHQVEVRDGKGRVSWATLEVRYQRLEVFPPVGKQKKYPSLTLTVIHARERNAPSGRPPIDWRLITNLPVRSRAEALEKLSRYAMRWKIETFHKILKSGCRAEETKLRASERIVNLIAVFCILRWRIFWMTMMNRVAPAAPPQIALTEIETRLLDRLIPDRTVEQGNKQSQPGSLASYLTKIARLGGYVARAKDPPPGNMVMWRGMSRLNDIELGALIGAGLVGN